MRRKNTVEKIGEHVVSRGGDGRTLSLGDNGRTPLEPLFTVNEAAAILRCSSHSLNRWRLTGGGPKFIYVGRRVRYRRADLIQFIDLSTRNSTSDPGEGGAA
jgi:Helix-turn-helix domain